MRLGRSMGWKRPFWRDPVRLGAALLAAMAAGSPARADWAYTHWGMSAPQVVAASHGAAHLVPPAKRTVDPSDSWEMDAEGSYSDEGLNLGTGFTFDTRSHGLVCVFYNAHDVERLKALMVTRLGKPQKESSYGPLQTMNWSKPDKVEFVINKTAGTAAVTQCAQGH